MKKKKVRKKIDRSTLLLGIAFFAGLSLLLYPSIANFWNSNHQAKAISTYVQDLENIDEDKYRELWDEAYEYNGGILERPNQFAMSEEEKTKYENTLKIGDSGVMGYISIPKINVTIPIYHGTSESVLLSAIGHIEYSSLPVGGESTHCVLSGHRGLPSAKLFTDLDELVEGDIFVLRILDEVLVYQVDQILIVLPDDVQALRVVEGEDLCTLVTCTPYGINTHRMLVRGRREYDITAIYDVTITADAVKLEPLIVAIFVSIPLLIILIIMMSIDSRRKRK